MIIPLIEYAKRMGKDPGNTRALARAGRFQTVKKMGRDWFIDENEPWPNNKYKNGQYVGWRKKHSAKEKSCS